MNFKVTTFIGTVRTVCTVIAVFSCVSSTMVSEGTTILCAKGTVWTGIRSFPSMCTNMFLEIIGVTAHMATIGTAKPLVLPIRVTECSKWKISGDPTASLREHLE